MRAMPRASRRPQIPLTGAPAGPESRHPPDPVGTRGIARMARSYGAVRLRPCVQRPATDAAIIVLLRNARRRVH
ncbi:hypothetical protein [Luteimonas suaedae]|uniref:hypothetical protein n=1 Tax=Luteimonas suaedae TaxID=2605430 RepID=UPI0011EBBC8C|nr:hypothetical protein [Luteimonas suaedae]